MVFFALENAFGGELFVPKIPSYNILDIAKAVNKNCEIKIIGIRAGEKLHEEMITETDAINTYDIGDIFVIVPNNFKHLNHFIKKYNCKKVSKNFSYNSRDNPQWENVETLKTKIKNLNIL